MTYDSEERLMLSRRLRRWAERESVEIEYWVAAAVQARACRDDLRQHRRRTSVYFDKDAVDFHHERYLDAKHKTLYHKKELELVMCKLLEIG